MGEIVDDVRRSPSILLGKEPHKDPGTNLPKAENSHMSWHGRNEVGSTAEPSSSLWMSCTSGLGDNNLLLDEEDDEDTCDEQQTETGFSTAFREGLGEGFQTTLREESPGKGKYDMPLQSTTQPQIGSISEHAPELKFLKAKEGLDGDGPKVIGDSIIHNSSENRGGPLLYGDKGIFSGIDLGDLSEDDDD